ncbi:MAG: hypothetical protein Q9217_005373 [Psora testacea]
MPRILSYTPAWLSRPSPGSQVFNNAPPTPETRSNGGISNAYQRDYVGPNLTLARRNTEIFVVMGKQIRWADLPSMKDQWQTLQDTTSKLPQAKLIEDLLNAEHNKQPIKLKTYTIGPTTHVLAQSSLARVLWHPLGESSNCLVTVTTDSVVRLWEFNVNNRWSADSPALAIDLKKLVVATSEDDDVGPKRSGRNKVFTADAAGMEVASACFGGAGHGDESPWSAMTLWVAMNGGDIYALCPLLPSKWQPPSNLLPALSSAIVEKWLSRDDERAKGTFGAQQVEDQFAWISDLDKQEALVAPGESGLSPIIKLCKRPSKLSPVPRLQGPFQMLSEDTNDDLELSDIHVIPGKAGTKEAMDDDSELDSDPKAEEEGLSMSIVCLMTREGRVYVCLDLEGVEAQWLPRKVPIPPLPPPPDPYLVLLEGLDTLRPGESCLSEWPMFSQDVQSRYCFFTTHSRGVYYFSFESWLRILEQELQTVESAGTPFRISILCDGPGTLRQRILSFEQGSDSEHEPSIPACLVMQDSDLGYFLLATFNTQVQAAVLDKPYRSPVAFDNSSPEDSPDTTTLSRGPPRSVYQPSPSFYAPSFLSNFLDVHVQARHKRMMKEGIRLSTATLDLMTEAHRVLSKETHQLGAAASQLFNRCQMLQDDLREQIMWLGGVVRRVDQVTGEDPEGLLDGIEGKGRAGAVLEERMERAEERQGRLVERCERLRKSVKKIRSRELSEREKAWRAEVEGISIAVEERKVEKDSKKDDGVEVKDEDEVNAQEYASSEAEQLRRYREIRDLKGDLVQRAKEISQEDHGEINGDTSDKENSMIPTNLRRKKVAEVMQMLDHEDTIVKSTQSRLEQLEYLAAALS